MHKRAVIGAILAVTSLLPAQSAQAQAKTHFFRYEYPSEGKSNSVSSNQPSQQASAAVAPVVKLPAVIRVVLPDSQARVWIANYATVSKGTEREFQSPPVAVGSTYMYSIRVEWAEAGREILQERIVFVSAGQATVVDFRQPATVARTVMPPAPRD